MTPIAIIALSLSLFLIGSVQPDHPKIPIATPSNSNYVYTGKTPDGWSWTNSPLTGDDTAYKEIRSRIGKAIGSGEDKNTILLNYRAKAQANSKDPKAVFAWAYSAWEESFGHDNLQDAQDPLIGIPEAMGNVPNPRTYNFARIRFLIQSYLNNKRELEPIAQRLYQYNPKDYYVEYQYACVLMLYPSDTTEGAQALPLIQQMIKDYPDKANPYWLLAFVYINACNRAYKYDVVSTDKALAALRRYLQLAPKDDYDRPAAQGVVKDLEHIKVELSEGHNIFDEHDHDK